MKFGLTIGCLAVPLLVSGCMTAPPPLSPGDSIVTLHASPSNEMIARRLDKEMSTSLTRFVLREGRHDLEVGITRDDYNDTHRHCVGTLTYAQFKADEKYTLVERGVGREVTLVLVDSGNQPVANTNQVACL